MMLIKTEVMERSSEVNVIVTDLKVFHSNHNLKNNMSSFPFKFYMFGDFNLFWSTIDSLKNRVRANDVNKTEVMDWSSEVNAIVTDLEVFHSNHYLKH